MRQSEAFKVDRNGTQYFYDYTCRHCGGQGGSNAWAYTGYTCYRCGGTGRDPHPSIVKIYTKEYAKKLEQSRQKRREKKIAEFRAQAGEKNAEFFKKNGFDEHGNTYVALGDTYKIKDELKEAGFKYDQVIGWHIDHEVDRPAIMLTAEEIFEKNNYDWFTSFYRDGDETKKIIREANDRLTEKADATEYIGEIGQKVEITVTLNDSYDYSFEMGWKTINNTIYTFSDDAGNVVVWKTQTCLPFEKGQQMNIRATVKEHSVYRGKKQTIITRAKVVE